MDLPTLPSRHHIPKLLVQLGLDGIGLEVGVDQGKFSKVILENSRLSLLVSLDFWQSQEAYDEAYKRLSIYDQRSCLMKTWSEVGLTLFPDSFFDFIYIDSWHGYKPVKRDMGWWVKLKPGGIFAGHDYVEYVISPKGEVWIFGVIQAVNEFSREKQIKIFTTQNENCKTWYCQKRMVDEM